MFGTWRTEHVWNMEKRNRLEHGKLTHLEQRRKCQSTFGTEVLNKILSSEQNQNISTVLEPKDNNNKMSETRRMSDNGQSEKLYLNGEKLSVTTT